MLKFSAILLWQGKINIKAIMLFFFNSLSLDERHGIPYVVFLLLFVLIYFVSHYFLEKPYRKGFCQAKDGDE